MELRQAIISKSAIINVNANQSREFMEAYLFIRHLAAQYKHPIVLNYKSQLNPIRYCFKLTDHKFRKLIKSAMRYGLATIQGNHLRLHSNNADQQLKTVKRYDYQRTSNPTLFMQMVLLSNHYHKQKASIHKKKDQTHLGLRNSDPNGYERHSNANNYSITASCKAISDLFKLNSTTASNKLLKDFDKRGIIKLYRTTTHITKKDFDYELSIGRKNIRYNKEKKFWYRINAATFELNYTFRKQDKATPFDKLPREAKATYLQMGYTRDAVNKLLG